MTPVMTTRRRVEEFAALVDAPTTPGTTDTGRYADLVELVGSLRATAPVEARAVFVSSLREQLLLAAETALVPSATSAEVARLTLPPRRTRRDRRIAAAVGGIALVAGTTSMAMAAQSALPGDALYPIKRAIESAQTGVAMGQGSKGEHLLADATGRLAEVGALSRGDDLRDTLAISSTLNAFTDQATQASDLLLSDYAEQGHQSSISDLRDFTSESLDELGALEAVVPDDARDELMHAASVIFQIDAAAAQACATCGGAGITEIPNVFAPVSSGTTGAEASPTLTRGPDRTAKHHGTSQAKHPHVPAVDGSALPPGSVLHPPQETGGDTTPSAPPTNATDPIQSLTDGLTGNGNSQPTSNPQLPDPSEIVDGVGDTLNDVKDGLSDPLNP